MKTKTKTKPPRSQPSLCAHPPPPHTHTPLCYWSATKLLLGLVNTAFRAPLSALRPPHSALRPPRSWRVSCHRSPSPHILLSAETLHPRPSPQLSCMHTSFHSLPSFLGNRFRSVCARPSYSCFSRYFPVSSISLIKHGRNAICPPSLHRVLEKRL